MKQKDGFKVFFFLNPLSSFLSHPAFSRFSVSLVSLCAVFCSCLEREELLDTTKTLMGTKKWILKCCNSSDQILKQDGEAREDHNQQGKDNCLLHPLSGHVPI